MHLWLRYFWSKIKDKGLKILLLLIFLIPLSTAHAQDILQEGSLAISPFLIDTEILAGPPKQYTIEIFNTENTSRNLSYSIQDFVPSGPHGEVRFLPVGENNKPEYSLNDWIKVTGQPKFSIPAQGKTSITFELIPPKDASVGSHYGGLLFSFANDTQAEIQISKKIGALIIARFGRGKPEGIFTASTQILNKNTNIVLSTSFNNTGNTHLTPKGKFYIYNMFGQLSGVSSINPEANLVLPNTYREFTSIFKKPWLLGKYRAEGIIYYGTDPKLEARQTLEFWVFPLKRLATTLATSVLLAIILYMSLKKYNSWIIRRNR